MQTTADEREAVAWESRFSNWVRWCKSLERGTAGRCYSAEGNYRGPQGTGHPTGWGDWENGPLAPLEVKQPIDVPDALKVNRAYTRLAQLSPTYAEVIRVLVFQPWIPERRQAQMLGTHYQRLTQMLGKAKTMLQNNLKTTV